MFELKDVLLILIGAVIGFGIDRIKGFLDRRLARKALLEELALNLRMIPQFRRYLESVLSASAQGHAPNMRAIHFARASYEANYSAVLPLLSQAERSSYHLIYDHLAICNEISDEAGRLLSETQSQEEFGRRLRVSATMFDSLLTTVDQLREQISQHLNGSPQDLLLSTTARRSEQT
jgi:hypothetical protein